MDRPSRQKRRTTSEQRPFIATKTYEGRILSAVGAVFRDALSAESEPELAQRCLTVAEDLTFSDYGWIGEVNANGRLDTIALSALAWDACRMPKTQAPLLTGDMEFRGVWSVVLESGKPLLTNSPDKHPSSVGLPEGHPPLQAFLGVPLLREGRTFGMIALAKREGCFVDEDLRASEHLAIAIAEALLKYRTMQALEASEHRWSAIADALRDALIVTDDQGRVTFWNGSAESLFGLSQQDALGRPFNEFVVAREAGQGGEARASESQRMRWGGRAAGTNEIRARRADGTEFPAELSLSSARIAGSWHSIGIVRDITQRKNQEEELKRSNNELQHFAHVASHDLREPLRKITAFGDLLAREIGREVNSRALDYLHRMVFGAQRMQSLIDDVLALSRIGSSGRSLKPVSLESVVRGVLDDMSTTIASANASVQLGVLPVIDADDTQMRQLFQNLIDNALKFRAPGIQPTIAIVAETNDRQCCIEVTDNGIGIAPEDHERIFQLFQRLHNRGEYEGTGLGLALCHRIVGRHQGTLHVRSALGAGATFVIRLPCRSNGNGGGE